MTADESITMNAWCNACRVAVAWDHVCPDLVTEQRDDSALSRSQYSLNLQRRIEALFDHPDARDHDQMLPNGAAHTWRCIPIAAAIDAIEAADEAEATR